MNKKQIRLTESDLKQIVKESVNKILNEAYGTPPNKDIEMANKYRDAGWPQSGIEVAKSDDNYSDISYDVRQMTDCFLKIIDIAKGLEEGIRSDENGGLYRHTRHYKGDKDSDSLNAIYPYIMTLEKICDKGLDITERLSNHLIQNIGLNPKEY